MRHPTFDESCSYTSKTFSKPKEKMLEISLQALFVNLKSPLHSVMHVILIMPSLYFPTFIHE